jgi:hypothetical protein
MFIVEIIGEYSARRYSGSGMGQTAGGGSETGDQVLSSSSDGTWTAIGGNSVQDTETEEHSCSLNSHNPNSEDCTVTYTRKTITIPLYMDKAFVAIRPAIFISIFPL